jgi:hypothetical protein
MPKRSDQSRLIGEVPLRFAEEPHWHLAKVPHHQLTYHLSPF